MTGTREVVIARTGAANLASVRAAFERLGARVRFSESPGLLEDAPAVVLPGVGAFGPAMRRLRETGGRCRSERARREGGVLALRVPRPAAALPAE
jgi:glutamine amidotransferase